MQLPKTKSSTPQKQKGKTFYIKVNIKVDIIEVQHQPRDLGVKRCQSLEHLLSSNISHA